MSGHVKLVFSYLRENPKLYLSIVILSVLIGGLDFLGISSLLPAVNILLGEKPANISSPVFKPLFSLFPHVSMNWIFGGYVVFLVLQMILSFMRDEILHRTLVRSGIQWCTEYIGNILNSPFEKKSIIKPGEIEMVITRNISFAGRIRFKTAQFVSDSILSLSYVILALFVSIHSFLVFCLVWIVLLGLHQATLRIRVQYSEISREKQFMVAQYIAEYFSDIRGLMVYKNTFLLERIKTLVDASYRALTANSRLNHVMHISHQPLLLLAAGVAIFIWKSFFHIPNGTIVIMLFTFYRAAPKFGEAITMLSGIIEESPSDIRRDLGKWSAAAEHLKHGDALPIGDLTIELKSVSVSQGHRPLLYDVNMTFPSRGYTMIFGQSGAGKSTILDVICGFKKIDGGQLLIGGIPSDRLDYPAWLQRDVSLVRPESVVISGTLIENIGYLEDDVDRERVRSLVKSLGIDEFLSLRGAIDYTIESRGENLSSGQRQRILIARALYKQPKLLILDEPTSNLDPKTEADIQYILSCLKKEITIIVVSHKEVLQNYADKIYQVTPSGTVNAARLASSKGR